MRYPDFAVTRHALILFSLWMTPGLVQSEVREDTFAIPMQIHQADTYLEDQRFRDADHLLTSVYESMLENADSQTDRFMRVLKMLAQSRSQQGLHDDVYELLHQQHRLVSENYSPSGYVYASSLSRLAEARYREGNTEAAIELGRQALSIYRALRPVPADALKVLSANLAQYKIAPFSSAFLPLDLSDFYTRCEQLANPAFAVSADDYMLGFVEVGVDFEAIGPWKILYNNLKYPSVEDYEGDAERRLFIPDQSLNMLNEICIVEESNGVVINALSIIE